jgi:hypothetical protein
MGSKVRPVSENQNKQTKKKEKIEALGVGLTNSIGRTLSLLKEKALAEN